MAVPDDSIDALESVAKGYGDGTRIGMRTIARLVHDLLTTAARSDANAEARKRLGAMGRYANRCRARALRDRFAEEGER